MFGLIDSPEIDDGQRGRRREIVATLGIVLGLAVIAGGRPIARRLATHPSRETCQSLLERYAELESRARTPDPPRDDGREPHPAPLPRRSPEVADVVRCTREITQSEAGCASQAPDVDAFERCMP